MIHRDCERAKRNNRKHTNRANNSSLSQLYANRKEWSEAESEREKEKGRRREGGRRDEKRNVGGETVKSRQKRKKRRKENVCSKDPIVWQGLLVKLENKLRRVRPGRSDQKNRNDTMRLAFACNAASMHRTLYYFAK